MPYPIKEIATILQGEAILANPEQTVEYLQIDSRRLVFPAFTLFFALQSPRRNGENFVDELYHAGVRNFVVSPNFAHQAYNDANFIKVDDTLRAMQKVAAFHRSKFNIPVIGITGSNGKTIVKEWLYQLLQQDFNIVRSPKSYNSQIGVALSVWQLNTNHTLGIFEAGISQPGEMTFLESIILPTIGILTNVGAAHSAGFSSKEEKVAEKCKLFKNAHTIISNNQDEAINAVIANTAKERLFVWGDETADLQILAVEKDGSQSTINATYGGKKLAITIPFTDSASVENAITCWSVLLYLGIENQQIQARMLHLQPVEMRLQLQKGINNCTIINDSYSNDISSLRLSLNFLHQQSGNQPTAVILSDLGDSSSDNEQYEKVLQALIQHKVDKFIGIGPRISALQSHFKGVFSKSFFYTSTDEFIQHFPSSSFKDEVVLIKGARAFEFERINLMFRQQMHQTVLEVNLTAMAHNLKEYQQRLQPTTKLMAMVKAFSYGSGSAEVASVLQFHKVDYLAVAYADEGVELRKAGIQMPIMVMNPEAITFQSLVEYNLEPEMYSFGILQNFTAYLEKEGLQQFPVHIKIDTGMHRLGFEEPDLLQLATFLQQNPPLVVKSVFSHLVGSESAQHDGFTQQQVQLFTTACKVIKNAIGYSFIKHIANTAAIFRHPHLQFDMVRLGIGLYGVDSSSGNQLSLQTVATLRTTIAQIRQVKAGETIGYSRKGVVKNNSLIATIRIGYADGFNRKLGNGKGKVYIKGKLAPVIGNVCMDMTMVDITDIEGVTEGDTVEIFGAHLPVETVADWCETIPYEIMTAISHRVKREYYEE